MTQGLAEPSKPIIKDHAKRRCSGLTAKGCLCTTGMIRASSPGLFYPVRDGSPKPRTKRDSTNSHRERVW